MLVPLARDIAERVHGNQVDKKDYPYVAHILDVASRVAHLGESYEVVGLLHDAIEDADPAEFQAQIIGEINDTFDDEISDAIKAMTKSDDEDYFTQYLPKLRQNKIALQVKIADASHNLSKAHLIDDIGTQNKMQSKYTRVLNELGVDGHAMEKPLIFEDGAWIEAGK